MKRKNFVFGIAGPVLTKEEIEFFTTHPVLGFILFKRNIVSVEQLIALSATIKKLYNDDNETLIFVDQEGGKVERLKPPVSQTIYPTQEYFGKLYELDRDLALKTVNANYTMMMQDLVKFGINSPCAPVCDLRYLDADEVIGDRSFGSDVHTVVELCNAAVNAIANCAGIPIIKHIPGHGRANVDSHHKLPVVKTSLTELEKTDFAVFKELSKNKNVKWAMTAHVIFEELDKDLPVTLSKKAIEFIRTKIGFNGILISDAIEMFALHQNIDTSKHEEFTTNLTRITQKSFDAGCDIVLHCTGNISEMYAIYDCV